MKTIYEILLIIGLVLGLMFAAIDVTVNVDMLNPNTYICNALLIPAMITNPDFHLFEFYDGCGR